jgi:hypothetical protein
MEQLSYQIQDVAGVSGSECSPRLPVHASTSTPGVVTTVGTYQLPSVDPAPPGGMPAWLATRVICAATAGCRTGIGRLATQPGFARSPRGLNR